jgi:hypothetical protein
MSDRRTDAAALRQHLFDAEKAIVAISRQLTEAIVWKRATGGLSVELNAIAEERDAMRDRLMRLEGGDQD